MSIRIRNNLDLDSLADELTRKGQYALINQVYADINQYVPRLSGDLRSQSNIASDMKSIVWNAPYAARQYYNVNAKFTTPGTGPRWDEMALSIHRRSWERVAMEAMKL